MVKSVLTIAGSDSSGGAGIQTDLKTFSALGVYGMSAITSITAQNTTGVSMIEDISADCVYAQIKACLEDIGASAIKVGMLSNAPIIAAVNRAFDDYKPTNVVIDPVMVATTGFMLLKEDAVDALIELFKYASLITPNKSEAEVLAGIKINDWQTAERAALKISEHTNSAILIKGVAQAADLYYRDGAFQQLLGEWVDNTNSHGTGCTLSSAIAAYLARGLTLDQAVQKGKTFITEAIRAGLPIGAGSGPTNPLYAVWRDLKG